MENRKKEKGRAVFAFLTVQTFVNLFQILGTGWDY